MSSSDTSSAAESESVSSRSGSPSSAGSDGGRRRAADRAARKRKIQDLVDKRMKKMAGETKAFKYRSNSEQFEFNLAVMEDLRSAKRDARGGSSRRRIKRAMRKLKHRNKLIKIADASKGGWKTVEEYEGGEIGKDAKDRRRIRNAERLALAKKEESKKGRGGISGRAKEQGISSGRAQGSRGSDQFRNAPQRERNRREVTCFRCQKSGHIAKDCWSFRRQENYGRTDGY